MRKDKRQELRDHSIADLQTSVEGAQQMAASLYEESAKKDEQILNLQELITSLYEQQEDSSNSSASATSADTKKE